MHRRLDVQFQGDEPHQTQSWTIRDAIKRVFSVASKRFSIHFIPSWCVHVKNQCLYNMGSAVARPKQWRQIINDSYVTSVLPLLVIVTRIQWGYHVHLVSSGAVLIQSVGCKCLYRKYICLAIGEGRATVLTSFFFSVYIRSSSLCNSL